MSPKQSIKQKKYLFYIIFLILLLATSYYFYQSSPTSIQQKIEEEKKILQANGEFYYRSPIREPLNPGLPRFLLPLRNERVSTDSKASMIFLLVRKPIFENQWEDQQILKIKFFEKLKNAEPLDMGHVQWGWSCNINGQRIEGASGYNGEQRNQTLELATSGWGVTAGLMTMHDGYFESPWEIEVKHRQNDRKYSKTMTLIVDSKSCENFLKSYEDLKFNVRLNKFNLVESNLNQVDYAAVGANCITVSKLLFSKIKNFPIDIFEKSLTSIEVDLRFFGLPNHQLPSDVTLSDDWKSQLKQREGFEVKLIDFMAENPNTQSIKLKFFDTQKIFKAISDYPETLELR